MLTWIKRLFGGSGWVNKDPGDDYWYSPRGSATAAGVDVNEGISLGIPTVYACVSKIAKTVASLPIQVYDKPSADSRVPVDHPINELFAGAASQEASGMTVSESRMLNLLLWGMGYNYIQWNFNQTEPIALIPLESAYVEPIRDGNELYFLYRQDGQGKPEKIPSYNMFWVPGLSIGGLVGLSPVKYHRDTMGVILAKKQFSGSFFKNGARVGGFIKRSMEADRLKPLSKEGSAAMLASFNEIFQGSGNAFRWGMLREDMTAEQMPSMPLEDAQYIEGMQFDREDVCGIFDCPPSKIQDHTHSTFSNIEHLGIDWATDTILPWCVRVEQAVKRTFFRDSKLYLKHNLAGIARGDLNSRYTAYATGRNWGWLSINDVRRLEDMNPVPNGDDYLQPLNMQVVGAPQLVQAPAEPPPEEPEDDDTTEAIRASVEPIGILPDPAAVAEQMQPLIVATCETIIDAEVRAVDLAYKRADKKGTLDGFGEWLHAWCRKHVRTVQATLEPVLATFERLAGIGPSMSADAIGEAWAAQVEAGVLNAVDAGDVSAESRRTALNDRAAWVTRILIGGSENG